MPPGWEKFILLRMGKYLIGWIWTILDWSLSYMKTFFLIRVIYRHLVVLQLRATYTGSKLWWHMRLQFNHITINFFKLDLYNCVCLRIPGLSEKFLYINDDILIGKEIWPEDFISPVTGSKVSYLWLIILRISSMCHQFVRSMYNLLASTRREATPDSLAYGYAIAPINRFVTCIRWVPRRVHG